MLPRRIAPTILIVISVSLQVMATARLLCPPRSIPSLAWIRVGCAPRLWPFIDYPMFSDPHAHGDVLAWVDVQRETPSGERTSVGLFEVPRASRDEPLDRAYERKESELRARFESELAAQSARLTFERKHLVLTNAGLVPPCADCPTARE
jgi:hypothetical protein